MSRRVLVIGVWLIALCFALTLVARATISTSLAGFLPTGSTSQERLATEGLQRGMSGRLILVALGDGESTVSLADSQRLVRKLRDSDRFELVATRPATELLASRDLLFEYRYLLSDRTSTALFRPESLRPYFQRIVEQARRQSLTFDEKLAATDPTGEFAHVLGRIFGSRPDAGQPGNGWKTDDGRRVVIAVPSAPAEDLDAMAAAVATIRDAARELPAILPIRMAGTPAVAVDTRERIRSEALRLAALASLAVVLIIGLALRSLSRVVLCALPVASGALIGCATAALAFGEIHGIALAFAATLLGVTVDYPLHLYWRTQNAGMEHALREIGGPLAVGALSTVIGFAALGFTGFPGLQQLAIITTVGILAAALVCRFVLPMLAPSNSPPLPAVPGEGHTIDFGGKGLLLTSSVLIVVGLLVSFFHARLNTDLQALSPIPEEVQVRDRALRTAVGTGSPRFLVQVTGPEPQHALRATERVTERLRALEPYSAAIAGLAPVTNVLPSSQTQLMRRQQLPDRRQLQRAIARAVDGLPLQDRAFAPFLRAVETSRNLPPLTRSDFPAGFVRNWIDERLFRFEGNWTSVISFGPGEMPANAETRIAAVEEATLIDLTALAGRIVNRYQRHAATAFTVGMLAIALVIAVALRDGRRTANVLATVLGALGGTIAIMALLDPSFNIFEVVALLLVAGIGIDYALFASIPGGIARGSVFVCAASTVVVFGLLATASTPLLQDIGITVTTGTILAATLALAAARGHHFQKAT